MSEDHFKGLSAEQREHEHAALAGAFGRASIDAIAPVAGGASTASTFRIDSGGQRYLLRMEGEPSPLRNPHQYVSMRIATEAGIAPEIHYLDEPAPIVVTDFIGQQSLKTYPGGPRAPALAVGEVCSPAPGTPAFSYSDNSAD